MVPSVVSLHLTLRSPYVVGSSGLISFPRRSPPPYGSRSERKWRDMTAIYFHNLISLSFSLSTINSCHIPHSSLPVIRHSPPPSVRTRSGRDVRRIG